VQSVGRFRPNVANFFAGHIEGLFKEVAAPEGDDTAALLDKFGVLVVGPPLLDGIYTISSPRA
jgi:hypothetical protein